MFDYNDFGPQVIAHEVIGMEWWQWQPHGDSRPKDYDVKVVVYRNVTLEDVKAQFPVVPEEEQDYRYLEYGTALEYLNDKISDDVSKNVTDRLKETRERVVNTLGYKY
ncbi:hypothetical protein [Marinimicrobium agarilyticum]|uniref:hypothetical protein n=1 Tax=Marinimicrobium agarilyticum TaxID=306546 RepID=UPI0003FFA25F|nr:hypothetical protein [Marinimicrobium agarilyticum]